MDIKNNTALKKKRELLLTGINKRKMSLRKHMDKLKQNECRLDITQITKCVFLGSLCLKPVPHLFDSPLLLEELDTKVGDMKTVITVNDENEENPKTSSEEVLPSVKNSSKKEIKKRCLNNLPKIRKKSLRERNDSKSLNGVVDVKVELASFGLRENSSQASDNNEIPHNEPILKISELTPEKVALEDNTNIKIIQGETSFQTSPATDVELEEITLGEQLANEDLYEFEDVYEDNLLDLKLRPNKEPNVTTEPTDVPPDIKSVNSNVLDYDDVERLKREPTPELILSDSDEDAIDQLMFNIMDIKVGPNVFEKNLFNMSPPHIEEEFNEEYSSGKEDSQKKNTSDLSKEKKLLLKRTPQCKICSQVFSNYMQLKKHKATHNGDRPYICLKCNENHTTLDQLIAHLRTHQGKCPYVCKKCNKGFKTTKALENHQPIHVLQKAVPQKKGFKCEVCGKEFRKLCDLERHTRVHTGEKPSVCNICNRRFQQAHNLNKHLLIHTKEKPFECDICNKKFGRNDVLNRHLLTHSVRKPNHCNICMKSFIRVSQLLAHKEKYHSGKAS